VLIAAKESLRLKCMDDLEALQPTTINMKETNNEGLLISEQTLLRDQALVKESTSVEERHYIPFTSQTSLDYGGCTRPPYTPTFPNKSSKKYY
jgi:hypothetical protein